MKIKYSKETIFLYFVLFCSCFNDILRIPGTGITFFRVLLPFSLIYCLISNSKGTIKIIVFYVIFEMISLLQSFVFTQTNDLNIQLSVNRFILYSFYYLSIFSIFIIINTLYHLENMYFIPNFLGFYTYLFFLILIIFSIYGIFGFVSVSNLGIFENVNNYATKIAAFFPFLFVGAVQRHNRTNFILVCITLYMMFANDCKISLIGITIEIIIFTILAKNNIELRYGKLFTLVGIYIMVFFGFFLLNYDIILNSYNLTDMLLNLFKGVVHRNPNVNLGTSGNFRLSIMLKGFEWIEKTHLFGIGIGNAGILMRRTISVDGGLLYQKAISLHAFLLEFLLECGFIAILVYIVLIKEIIGCLKGKINGMQMVFLMTFISMWVWGFQPSEMITEYFVIGFLCGLFLINRKMKRLSLTY